MSRYAGGSLRRLKLRGACVGHSVAAAVLIPLDHWLSPRKELQISLIFGVLSIKVAPSEQLP